MRTVLIIASVLFCTLLPSAQAFSSSSRIITTNTMVAKRKNHPLKTIVMTANNAAVEAGIGDEGCKLPAPSKINTLPVPAQAGVFVAIYLAIYVSTMALVSGVESLKELAP